MNYEPVIGLEIHVELRTRSKMFCGCPADHFGTEPNSITCPVCLGLPGALPVPNKQAVEWTIMLGLALGADIARVSKFDRKHYFYPDLPKGYQISQYDEPLCRGGKIMTSDGAVRIHRVHLEEDTGKLQHAALRGKKVTLGDFNRSGVPLVEIVTEPDIRSSGQAKEFLKKLHQIVRYLGISDADMEKGSMRLEPNISLRPAGSNTLPKYKVEVKNINSFRFAERAIEYEIARHIKLLDNGEIPIQETRGWNEGKNCTVSQRTKEGAADYRYFPEPDIPPMRFRETDIQAIALTLPELPDDRCARLVREYNISEQDATILTDSRKLADYFEKAADDGKEQFSPSDIAKWIVNKKLDIASVQTTELIAQLKEAKAVVSVSDNEMQMIIHYVLAQYPKAVADYTSGKEQALMFLTGMVRRKIPKGDTNQIITALRTTLETMQP